MKLFPRVFEDTLLLTAAQAENAVTNSDLVNEALHKSPEIRFFKAEIDAESSGRQSAGQLVNPELSTEFGRMSVAQPKEGLVWRVGILQVVDFPGRMALRKTIADRDIDLAQLGLQQFKSQFANEVRARAGDVPFIQGKESAARSLRERVDSLLEALVQHDTGSMNALLERRILQAIPPATPA